MSIQSELWQKYMNADEISVRRTGSGSFDHGHFCVFFMIDAALHGTRMSRT
jgi:hypothetical protein